MKSEKIIWSNADINLDEWEDYFKEEHEGEELTENEKYEIVYSLNNDYLDDERMNLNKYINGDIVVIASLGLWNGRKSGYKILDNNLSSIFEVAYDYNKFYVDRYDVKAECTHHDGTNFYTFRELKPLDNHDNFFEKIYNGTVTQKDITRHTTSLKKYVKAIYGF